MPWELLSEQLIAGDGSVSLDELDASRQRAIVVQDTGYYLNMYVGGLNFAVCLAFFTFHTI